MSTRSNLLTIIAGLLLAVAMTGPATAHTGQSADARAQLRPVAHNGQADGGSHSTASVRVLNHGDGTVTIIVEARNVTPNQPHAQHIHGEGDRCPTPEARDARVDDGLIDTAEGVPFYGSVVVSLTTSDTTLTAGDALALNRFPVADANGNYTYERTLTIGSQIPADVVNELEEYEVVIHGIDLDGSGAYDGEARSSLTDSAPLEATIPAACGGFIANR